MGVGVAEAAARLRVSDERVRALVAQGLLEASRVSGRYVISVDSLQMLARQERPAHVRPFARRVAWGAAALADGHQPSWLTASEVSRLRRRLTTGGASPGTWLVRLRGRAADCVTVRVGRRYADQLLGDPRTFRTGVSAANLVTDPLHADDHHEVWVATREVLDDLAAQYGLLTSSTGNVTVRVAGVAGVVAPGSGDGNAYRLIVAADLLSARGARERHAGRELVHAALDEQRWRSRRSQGPR